MIKVRLVKKIDGIEVQNGDTITLGLKVGQRGVAGRSVVSIIKTDTQELTDTYTITYSDNTTSTFDVVNGADGDNGKTAYQSAVDGGYTGTEAQFNADLALVSTKQDALGFTPENIANKGQNNGYAGLDAGGKVPLANLPSTLLVYKGVWNASTNTPELTTPDTDKKGWVYNVSVAGTQFGIDFKLGDWAIFNDNGIIEKSDNSDDVVSVNGQQGVVVLDYEDVGASPLGHDHSGEGINPDYVVLDTEYTDTTMVALPIGSLFYNIDQLAWILKTTANTYLNLGEENTYIAKNGDLVTHLEGQVTYVTSGGGNLDVMTLASSANGKIDALLTQDVLHTGNGRGMYCFGGKVRTFPYSNVIKSTDNENTWVEGAELYLCSEAGRYSTTKEAAPAKCSIVGKITQRNGANISVSFRPFKALSVSDLSDVDGAATTIGSGDSFFIKVGNLWKTITESNFLSWLGNTFQSKLTFSTDIEADKASTTKVSAVKYIYDFFGKLSTTNTWALLQTFTSGAKLTKIIPNSDSTTAIQITKADGATPIITFDTTLTSGFLVNIQSGQASGMIGYKHTNGDRSGFAYDWDEIWFYRRGSQVLGIGPSNILAIRKNTIIDGNYYFGIKTINKTSYDYFGASPTADTINDIRTSNQSGVIVYERCTVANATKGSGTWVEIFRIDSNGFQSAQYDDILPSAEWTPASGGTAPDTATHTIGGMAANYKAFDGGTTEESMVSSFEILHAIDIDALNRATAPLLMEIHTHGMPATTGSGDVKIFYDLVYQPVNAAPIAWGTYSNIITISANQQYYHKLGGVELTKPSSGYNIGDQIIVKYRRTPSDAQDTYAGDWLFMQCALHAPMNSNGSRTRYTK